jgi:hypothetical protein
MDIIPDGITTVDDAFSSRSNAEKFWATCYGYLPSVIRPFHDPVWIASKGDEFWYFPDQGAYPDLGTGGDTPHGLAIMQGGQDSNEPYLNYWDGGRSGTPMFRAIRECNIFLESVEEKNLVPDLFEEERIWWIGEVKFLKAYYHFYLMKLYGPIPIIRRNFEMNASPEEVRVFREPIDDVVDYIVELLDESIEHLSDADADFLVRGGKYVYGGRITKSIAQAVKAQVLIWAASPLFNGNDFYSDFKDSRGIQLIPADNPDISKWKIAADACLEAIRTAESVTGSNHSLYTAYDGDDPTASEVTRLKYTLRQAVTKPFNDEIVWPCTYSTSNGWNGWGGGTQSLWQMNMERESMPAFESVGNNHNGSMGTTLKMAEMFYTNNGLPIENDIVWQRRIGGLANKYDTRQSEDDGYHKYYIKQGIITAQLNFYREPRFYAYVGFDGGIWEGAGKLEDQSYVVDKNKSSMTGNVITGYYMKKVVNPESVFNTGAGSAYSYSSVPYTFPYIRLSDLYLLYAEALNESVEADNAVPADVYTYVNKVRARAGLKSVQDTWSDPSICNNTTLHLSKRGMREIIRRERTIELCFEGKRAEDVRRWRTAHEEFNEPIRGWNGLGPSYPLTTTPAQVANETYYLVKDHFVRPQGFGKKDYLWPIKAKNIDDNNNLVQNPGW